jgi:PilZ domain
MSTLLRASYRLLGEDNWRDCPVRDISVSGALIGCGTEVAVGHTLELRLTRKDNDSDVVLGAEVLRAQLGSAQDAALRFLTLTPDATRWLSSLLGAEHQVEETDIGAAPTRDGSRYDGPSVEALALSSIRLHEQSLYELLTLEPACTDGELESRCEKLIQDVALAEQEAVGRRQDRLRVLGRSLTRLRPLWTDPVKRARYDLRWGYVRAEERILEAKRGAGVHPHILAGIWYDLFPTKVREAEELVKKARSETELRAAFMRAIELEPFARKWREKVAALQRPVTEDTEGASMPSPFIDSPTVRGKLSDLPLRGLLLSMCDNNEDAELEVRFLGKSLGLIGISAGDVVIAICGEERGLPAIRSLTSVRDGEFQVRYAKPREDLRHMQEPAADLLRAALAR